MLNVAELRGKRGQETGAVRIRARPSRRTGRLFATSVPAGRRLRVCANVLVAPSDVLSNATAGRNPLFRANLRHVTVQRAG